MQRDFAMNSTLPPLVIPVDLAGELLGFHSRPRAYAAANSGAIPCLPGPGRKRVATAKLSEIVGRPITVEDIEAAEARLKPKREAVKRYSDEYRASRQALTGGGRVSRREPREVGGP
jgi:hypothetical protein